MKTVKTKARWWVIPDALWKKIAPLLPKRVNRHPFGGGRPPVPARKVLNGILFVLRTGCQWNALNATGICRSSTAHARFQAWRRVGVFAKLWARGLREYARVKGLDWSWQSMDGTMRKAPLGGAHTGPNPTDRAKGGVKRSLLCEGHGVPIGVAVAGANRHDMKWVAPTLESISVARSKPTPRKPQGLCLDKGYDYEEVRDLAHTFGYTAHIRARGGEAQKGARHRRAWHMRDRHFMSKLNVEGSFGCSLVGYLRLRRRALLGITRKFAVRNVLA